MDARSQPASAFLRRFYRPPLIGVIALVTVFLALPLTHSLSVLALNSLGRERSFFLYFPLGVIAAVMLWYGIRRDREVSGTLLGFAAGLLLWTGWASYAFRFNEISLGLPMPQLDDATRWPNNLLYIQGSIGICVVTLLYFVLDRNTRCNAFVWIQRRMGLDLGKPAPARHRNFCRITFIETVYVTWFFYGASLFLADPRFLGYQHPLAFGILGALLIWGSYLFWRLIKFTRVMAGIRYAIPTKAILWVPFGEAFPKYGFYEEVWLQPWAHPPAMIGVLLAFLVLVAGVAALPQRRSR